MAESLNTKLWEPFTPRQLGWLVGSYFATVACAVALIVGLDLSQTLYILSRTHMHRELDELVLGSLAAFFILSLYLVYVAVRLAASVMEVKAEKQRLRRSIEQTRHLVAMGKVLGGVSHSVNNHLLPVVALTEEVLQGIDPQSETAKDLKVVLDAAVGAANILKQLKNFSRQELVVRDTCNLDHALGQAVTLCEKIVPSTILLHKDIELLDVRLALSEVSLEIVLLNLVSNAIDAIGEKQGSITLSCLRIDRLADMEDLPQGFDQWVRIRVEDSGAGMPAETMERIFDPFFTTKPAGKGTGLGLSETYGIVRAAGGHISVESQPGMGTAFDIKLPVLINEGRLGNSRFMSVAH